MISRTSACVLLLGCHLIGSASASADDVIPHGQSAAPGAALSPAEAIRKMTVPPGFSVELVASEPDIVNPVAMTFDERGRVWITESLEYPRHAPGVGRDRIKILEDTDGDGKADTFTVFAEGLNIPSGIAVGHGGVWVANSPDILFLRDTDGDGKADRREVVVSGFGRYDTHELPNSLTWGPDGWLYGWNGVFNRSVIRHQGKTFDFTCAIFRIHPKTREFQLFCEGTSNPWGLAFDTEGSAFASACVIDHLWHLTETGYYHRQGGPYPPHTWEIGSIVRHKHQQAAYCGIHYYDSDTYPPEYRQTLFMGNIHGNGINADVLARDGSTYAAAPRPDFLSAHDAWFMPVSQQAGPDGCLYILDWYDRYHCYQDANRDPAGIDRLKGRLYRVRYKDAPRRHGFDLAKLSTHELISRLDAPKSYDREIARRLLFEKADNPTLNALESVVRDAETPRRARLNALWAMSGGKIDYGTLYQLLADPDPTFRAWAVRLIGDAHETYPKVRDRVAALAGDESPDVKLQVAIAAGKLKGNDPVALLMAVVSTCGDDPLIPRIVWRNLKPLLADAKNARRFAGTVTPERLRAAPGLAAMVPFAVATLLDRKDPGAMPIALLIRAVYETKTEPGMDAAHDAMGAVLGRVMSRELARADVAALREQLGPWLKSIQGVTGDETIRADAVILSAAWGDPEGSRNALGLFESARLDPDRRLDALNALVFAGDPRTLDAVARTIADPSAGPAEFRGRVLASLGRLEDDRVAPMVLDRYPTLEPPLQPRAVELLTQRANWRKALVAAVADGRVPRTALNGNQVRKLLMVSNDPALVAEVNRLFGTVRETRNPEREQVIARVRTLLKTTRGDAKAGSEVFKRVCAQCHKLYGEGQDVGPEITLNGRGSYEQILSNVFDPSLVIGAAFQGTTVATEDGRVLTGLVVEDGPRRVVLKLQGGKLETIPRDEIEAIKVSPLSLMPEDLEKQLKSQELADLFAYITLDRPPTDPKAKPIPGAEALHDKGGGR